MGHKINNKGNGCININGGTGGNNNNNAVTINYGQQEPDDQRILLYPRWFFKLCKIKTAWATLISLSVSTAVGVVKLFSEIYPLVKLFKAQSTSLLYFICMLLCLLTVLIMICLRVLQKRKFIHLGIVSLLTTEDSQIMIVKLEGDCPKCNGKLKLYQQPDGILLARCSINPQLHYTVFDYTL